jgi:UDP-GlcNAc:undecaprenyl-phosphate/decaprenyl-phosphate GlcNAc-1-phosphate transferase
LPALALAIVGLWMLARSAEPTALEMGIAAFLAAFGLTPVLRVLAFRAHALDHPDSRKTHPAPTPKLGGVAVIAAFILVLGHRPLRDHELLAIAICTLILMIAGAVDDTRGLSARWRLILQLVCSGIVISAGVCLNLLPGPFGELANILLSFLWIVGITNAYNFIDGMDGLAASLGALLALLLAVCAHAAAQPSLMGVCVGLSGALLGFLPHNLRRGRPASIFLGDSGSASVGFLLATLAIKEDWAVDDPLVSLAAPVLIFSVLIYDMVRTTAHRIAVGHVRSFQEWIDYVGRDHIHHRFTDLLGDTRQALVLILALSLGLGISALGLKRGAPGQALIFLVHGLLILIVVAVLEGAGARAAPPQRGKRG